jgi:ribonuclease-3
MNNIHIVLDKFNIKIKNQHLYDLALTHPSYNADANTQNVDYERLEFIGDAVLGYVSADLIFKHRQELETGDMSKLRSYLVKCSALAHYARTIGLVQYIKAGHSVSKEQINKSDRILEDVFEALIGAIFLDNDINVAYKYIEYFLLDGVMNTDIIVLTDAKTRLQEEMQSEHRDSVHYVLKAQDGPAHDRTFTVDVMFNDIVLATGVGKSKKAAEEDAAHKALEKRSK